MANPNREDLQAAREVFHETVRYPEISVDFDVRRLGFTSRQTAFQSEDLVFTMNFHEIRTGQNMPIMIVKTPSPWERQVNSIPRAINPRKI